MPTVKNIAKGPRGLHAKSGLVMLEPGETRTDLDISPAELASAQESGYFEIAGKLSTEAKKTADLTEQEKLDAAKLGGVDEPTKSYTPEEIENLRTTARGLKIRVSQKMTGAELDAAIKAKQAA